jgi:hypothetical protein
MSTISPNPLLELEYQNLYNSADPVAKNIVNDFTIIYNQYVIFMKTSDNIIDLTTLDNAATQIENISTDIYNIIKPCAKDPTPYSNPNPRCTINPSCRWIGDVESLFVKFVVLLAEMTSGDKKVKLQYQFIFFFMIRNFGDIITSTSTNYSILDKKYYLCGETTYTPKSTTDPILEEQYNAFIERMKTQKKNKDTRESDYAFYNFLLYILLPTVIFIILILLYINHFKKSDTPTSGTDTDTHTNLLSDGTTTEPPVKTGGAIYDTINFIASLSTKIFRL